METENVETKIKLLKLRRVKRFARVWRILYNFDDFRLCRRCPSSFSSVDNLRSEKFISNGSSNFDDHPAKNFQTFPLADSWIFIAISTKQQRYSLFMIFNWARVDMKTHKKVHSKTRGKLNANLFTENVMNENFNLFALNWDDLIANW